MKTKPNIESEVARARREMAENRHAHPMTPPNSTQPATFRGLLDGATPGPHRLVNQAHETTLDGFVVAYPEKGPSSAYFAYLADAKYFARLSPATMRLVLEALEMSEEVLRNSGKFDGELDRVQSALAALNNTKP